jgi:hydrogenase maturation protease
MEPTVNGTLIVGVGSPHGDDQIGWQFVELLGGRRWLPARVVAVSDGTQIIDHLDGCRRLLIVDACRSGAPVGTITWLKWPDPRIQQRHSHSTHGLGIWDALHLAERLGRLPLVVDVFGIEIGEVEPGKESSLPVIQALAELESLIVSETSGVVHA